MFYLNNKSSPFDYLLNQTYIPRMYRSIKNNYRVKRVKEKELQQIHSADRSPIYSTYKKISIQTFFKLLN